MAASGGTWVKAGSGSAAGKHIFVPSGGAYKFANGVFMYYQGSSWHIKSPYNPEFITDVKTISGKKWDPLAKEWIVPGDKSQMAKAMLEQHYGKAPIQKKLSFEELSYYEELLGIKKASAEANETTVAHQYKPNTSGEWSKQKLEITTAYKGDKVAVDAWIHPGGEYAITLNPQTGKYHITDMASKKTIEGNISSFENAKTKIANEYVGSSVGDTSYPQKFAVFSGLNAMPHNEYDKFTMALTNAQLSALQHYAGSGFENINAHLWNGKPVSATVKAEINAIDVALGNSSVPMNLIAVRSQHSGHPLYDLAKQLNVGDSYVSKGFDSASVNTNNSWGGGSVKVVYRVPKGAHGIYLNANHATGLSHEQELLFSRNSAWKVVGKKQIGHKIELHVEYEGVI